MVAEALAAALICIDPGHGTPPAVGAQHEPIGPGSSVLKVKDGGGAPGEAAVVLAIARRTGALLLARGYRVVMTRTGPTFRYGNGGNVARAEFCNRRRAALLLRIHADGSPDSSRRGVSTLYPAFRRGWTHGVLALALWPFVLAGSMVLLDRALQRFRRADENGRAETAGLIVRCLGGLISL